MEIKAGKNKFFLGDDEHNPLAEICFTPNENNCYVATKTFVDPVLRGQGIARKLVMHLVEHARKTNHKIIPVCSYVVRVYQEDSAIRDTLAEEATIIL
ncbi:MAG: GNAT family N-acetyltransferase [Bacilli bacterium]|jgi:predicted GNAT family acetyltransferase|nr:GNAT family N-acetyltransferase [Bacilli bacterium]HHU23955.1 N-acetyltransferase [Acholeplasmataceae bacterium]